MDVVVHQCSSCGLASVHRHNVRRHVESKCKEAMVLTETVKMWPGPPPSPDALTTKNVHIKGDRNTTHNTAVTGDHATVNNITVHVHPNLVYVGSDEERQALAAVFGDPGNLESLRHLPAAEIPAAVLRLWKGADADPRLHNIQVSADKVKEHRGPGHTVSVPRRKFVKDLVSDVLKTVANDVPKETTPLPEAMGDIQQELTVRDLEMTKKRRVSRAEAAAMRASGSREVYALKQPGQEYLKATDAMVDRELDFL